MSLKGENEDRRVDMIRKRKKFIINFTAEINYKGQVYEYVFEKPKAELEEWKVDESVDHDRLGISDDSF